MATTRPGKSGVAQVSDSGVAAPQIPFCFYGWETKLAQPSVSGCSPVFSGDSWRLGQASAVAVPLNWGFEPFLPPLQRRQNVGSAADLGSEIKAALPVICAQNDTVRAERLLSSPGRARLLATPGKVRDLQA